MLANFNPGNSLFWAILVGWIMTVVLHEFAHGIVAYWGGDYTIRERGGLTLNPLQYVDPVMSILLPIIFLMMGGIPLPGGSTFVRRDLLRGRGWNTAVSLAGPGMNLLLFFLCALPLHPKFGWLDPSIDLATGEIFSSATPAQTFLGAMAILQLITVVLNLCPVPPLDGFQALSPWLSRELRLKVGTPPTSNFLMIGFFIAVWKLPVMLWVLQYLAMPLLKSLGFGETRHFFWNALHNALS